MTYAQWRRGKVTDLNKLCFWNLGIVQSPTVHRRAGWGIHAFAFLASLFLVSFLSSSVCTFSHSVLVASVFRAFIASDISHINRGHSERVVVPLQYRLPGHDSVTFLQTMP